MSRRPSGPDDIRPLRTFAEIGVVLGMTEQQARALHWQALRKLRRSGLLRRMWEDSAQTPEYKELRRR